MKTWQGVAIAVMLPSIFALVYLVNAPITKSVSLLDKATNTDKMLANYEWFYEASNNYTARVSQIRAQATMLDKETDKVEKHQLRIELSAIQQTCRDLVAKYEANSGKLHVGYLKSKSLPESLNARQCETERVQ